MRRAASESSQRGAGKALRLVVLAAAALLATGCHHRKRHAYAPPPPPLQTAPGTSQATGQTRSVSPAVAPPSGPLKEPKGKPILVEVGLASWYGPSGHRSADGEKYSGKDMTAAHKTLPMGTIARVTNLSNGESVMVRITDRGPFVHGRILDLSESAAKKIDLYRMGVAKVKIEAFGSTMVAAGSPGRWCVQTGAFKSQRAALDLKAALIRRYAGSRVTEFSGASGYWVRIDPARHDQADAEAIKNWIGQPGGQARSYMVRIDSK